MSNVNETVFAEADAKQPVTAPAPQPVGHLDSPIYRAGEFFAARPARGLVYLSDGEDGAWVAGFADEYRIGFDNQGYWTQAGYRATHFAPEPAAPVDGITV